MTLSQLYAINDAQRFPCAHEVARPSTLFYADFKVAEAFGIKATYETFRNCGDLTSRDPKEVTELYVALNHLLFEANARNEELKAKGLFSPRTKKLENYYLRRQEDVKKITYTWSEEDRQHFFLVTD